MTKLPDGYPLSSNDTAGRPVAKGDFVLPAALLAASVISRREFIGGLSLPGAIPAPVTANDGELSEAEVVQRVERLLKERGLKTTPSDVLEFQAPRFTEPVELSLLMSPEKRAYLRQALMNRTYWVVNVSIKRLDPELRDGYRNLRTLMLIDGKRGYEILLP